MRSRRLQILGAKMKFLAIVLAAIGGFALVFTAVMWARGIGPEEVLSVFRPGSQAEAGDKVKQLTEDFAGENSLKDFTGVDIDENDPQIMDIYGTLKTVDTSNGKIYLDLAAPRYIQKAVEESYRQEASAEPKYITVEFDESLKVQDPFFATERPISEMAEAKDGNLEKMKGMFVVVGARLTENGQAKAEKLSVAGISK